MKKVFQAVLAIAIISSCNADSDVVEQVVIEPSGDAPSKVSLIFPENNSECTTGTIIAENISEVIFDWSDAQVGDSYRVTLIDLFSGETQTFDISSSSIPIQLSRGTPYSWKVTTLMNDSNESTDSNTESFYNSGPGVESHVPFPASNPIPSSGSSFLFSASTLDFSWEGNDLNGDIVEYDFYFGLENPPPLHSSELEMASIDGVSISAGNTYYWKIITRDSVGNESNSEIFYFTVQ